jgi:GDP-L-fucose synthase
MNERTAILGHRGMVGSALHRLMPDATIDGPDRWDYRNACLVAPNCAVLYLCAAKVGGIAANMAKPGEFIYDNLMIQCNVIEAARLAGVKLLVFLGSSCIYPKDRQVLAESDLLTGPLEPTNSAYAIAKIAGIEMLEAYRRQYGMEYLAVMPCNLYGPGDNYDPETAHFLPGMIRRIHDAKTAGDPFVTLWGTGTPRRELMHVNDAARIINGLVDVGARGLVNIGTGQDHQLSWYAEEIRKAVGYGGAIRWDRSRPDGVMRKRLNVARMHKYGLHARINTSEGIRMAYQSFLEEHGK